MKNTQNSASPKVGVAYWDFALKTSLWFFHGDVNQVLQSYLWKGGKNLEPRNRHPSHTLSGALGLDTNNPTNKRRTEVSFHIESTEQIQGAFPGIVRRNRGFRSPNGTHGCRTCYIAKCRWKQLPTTFSPKKLTKTSNLEVPPVPVTVTTWIFTWVVGNTYNYITRHLPLLLGGG